jgi:hypothetical protein
MVSTRRSGRTPAAPAAQPKAARPRRSRAAPSAGQVEGRRPGRRSSRRDEVAQAESLRKQVERLARDSGPARWNANPDDVQRSVVKLVLTIVEFLRQLLERQAIRRMDEGTISADETEAIGVALMRLEETVRDLGARFNLTVEDLNLDLGPVGKLL